MNKAKIASMIESVIDPYGKYYFLNNLKNNDTILDVGCGNVTYKYVEQLNSKLKYTGVDIVSDYFEDSSYYKLNFIHFVKPNDFTSYLVNMPSQYSVVLSIHNIEHCFNPEIIWQTMLEKLELNGVLYLRTPSTISVNFPSRKGTLNFYDDKTHTKPIQFEQYLENLDKSKYEVVVYKDPYYGSKLSYLIGLVFEPVSVLLKKVLSKVTWHYWGFETLLVIKRIK